MSAEPQTPSAPVAPATDTVPVVDVTAATSAPAASLDATKVGGLQAILSKMKVTETTAPTDASMNAVYFFVILGFMAVVLYMAYKIISDMKTAETMPINESIKELRQHLVDRFGEPIVEQKPEPPQRTKQDGSGAKDLFMSLMKLF